MTPIPPLETRNPPLYEALKSCIFDIIDFMLDKYSDNKPHIRHEYKWTATENPGLFTLTAHDISMYVHGLAIGDNSICGIKSVKAAHQVITDDTVWSKHIDKLAGVCFGVRTFLFDFFIKDLVTKYIDKSNGLVKTSATVSAVLNDYEQEFVKIEIDFVRITPLLGVEFSEAIMISERISLEILEDDEVVQAIELGVSGAGLINIKHGIVTYPCRFAIVTRYSAAKVVLEPSDEFAASDESSRVWSRLNEEESTAIDLLSLVTGSKIIPTGSIDKSLSPVFEHLSYQDRGVPVYRIPTNKNIDDLPAEDLRGMFNAYRKTIPQKQPELVIALRRFSMAAARDVAADKLLDLMISSEALFLENSAELTYRLAIRAATLLGINSENKESIYTLFKKMYDIRSKLVHGKMSLEDFNTTYSKHESNLELLSNHIRTSILKLTMIAIESPQKKKLVEWEKVLFGCTAEQSAGR